MASSLSPTVDMIVILVRLQEQCIELNIFVDFINALDAVVRALYGCPDIFESADKSKLVLLVISKHQPRHMSTEIAGPQIKIS